MEWFRGGRLALILASFLGCATAAHASTIIDLSAGGSEPANGVISAWTGQQTTGSGVDFHPLFSNSEASFEEWGLLEEASLSQIVAVPEPGAMLLVGTGLLLASRRLRKTS